MKSLLTKIRISVFSFIILNLLFFIGLVTTTPAASTTDPKLEPIAPKGAVKAELGFPTVGTTWVNKIVVHGKDIIITKTNTVLEGSTHDGKPVHRISDGAKITLIDKATGNWIAHVRADEELKTASPYVPTFAFPLWVGKSWKATYAYNDRERGWTFENIVWWGKVTDYEDVTVPAGTFKTFKVEGTDGGVQLVVWYSPKLNIIVKSSLERLPGHYIGPGKFISEIIEYAAK